MMRGFTLPVFCVCVLTTPAFAGSVSYLCTVNDVCTYTDHERANCARPAQNRTFDLVFELGEAYIDGIAFIDFEGTSITIEQHSYGHGAPPLMIDASSGEAPAPYTEATEIEAQNRPATPMDGSAFGSADTHFLSLSRGWSDGRDDSAQLIIPQNGDQTSFDAFCTIVGDT